MPTDHVGRFDIRLFEIVVDVGPQASEPGPAATPVDARGRASIRSQMLSVRKAVDIAHFQQDHQPQGEAHAWQAAQPFERRRLREDLSHSVLDLGDLLVQDFDLLKHMIGGEASVRWKSTELLDQ